MRRGFIEENKDHGKKHENTASKEVNEAIKGKYSGKEINDGTSMRK